MRNNQTLIPTDKKYPKRFVLNDSDTSWGRRVDHYRPQSYSDFDEVAARLSRQGVEIATPQELDRLATLTTAEAATLVGEDIKKVRHPLGRTGINGTGIYYEAGKSQTADLAAIRLQGSKVLEIAMVYNRGKWHLPGGFLEPDDEGDHRRAAIREGYEETGLDLSGLSARFITLLQEHVKPNSSRSVDMAYVTTQLEAVMLPDPEFGDGIKADDDAEKAEWVDTAKLRELMRTQQISVDHAHFAMVALTTKKLR